MSQKIRLLELIDGKRYQKIVLIVSVSVFLVLELLIYLAAAGQAGQKARVIIRDANGGKVYETTGTALSSYEKMVFENNYGPLRNYSVQLESESEPFPFRAWVSAAVGIPVGLALLMAFLIRVYLSLLYGEEKRPCEEPSSTGSFKERFGALYGLFHHFSIFHIGFAVVMSVLLLWMIPNFLGDFATITGSAIREYQWFFLGAAVFLALLIMWIIYLRYRLSRQMLENQLNLEKFRVEKQLLIEREVTPLIPETLNEAREP